MKLELWVTVGDFFFSIQLRSLANKVKQDLKLGQKVGCSFHEIDHISLVLSLKETRSELQVILDEFFLNLVGVIHKQGQIVLQNLILVFWPNSL